MSDRGGNGCSGTALQRYSEANVHHAARPGAHVRAAVRAQAEMMLAADTQAGAGDAARQPAANQSRLKISMLASVALAGITGLLVLQFDRGTQEEKDIACGQPFKRPKHAWRGRPDSASACPHAQAGPHCRHDRGA